MVSAVLIAAVAVGWSEWIVEAFVSYGGLARRLQAASAENTAGLHMALGLEARALAGPTLCRPCTQPVVWPATAWWFAVPPLVALGIAAAVSRRQAALAVVPTCAGLALLAEYTVTISYAAPRFLLPTYALASIPAAQGLLWVAGFLARRWWRTLWLTVVAAMLAVQLVSQLAILDRYVVPVQRAIRLEYISVAQAVREQGLGQPCVLVGHTAAPIAFSAGCTDVPTITHARQLRRRPAGPMSACSRPGVWPALFTADGRATACELHTCGIGGTSTSTCERERRRGNARGQPVTAASCWRSRS